MSTTLRSPDGRVVVPEKLRARRVAVRRNEGRRRLRLLGALAALLVILGAGWAFTRSPLLSVDTVKVVGSKHVTSADVARVAHLQRGTAMVDVRPGRAAAQIRSLPWVATASVGRHWPGEVTVTVTERTPIAQVAKGRSWFVVDATGRVLERRSEASAGLVVLTGLSAPAPGDVVRHAAALLEAATAMPGKLRVQVRSIAPGKGGTVDVRLRDGARAVVAGADELDAGYVSLVTLLDHVANLHAGCTIDVTVPESPTLTPAVGCA